MKSEDRKVVENAIINVVASVFDDAVKRHVEDKENVPVPSPLVIFVTAVMVDIPTFNTWGNLPFESQKLVIDRFYRQSMDKLKNI